MGKQSKPLTFFQKLAQEAVADKCPLGEDEDARRLTCPLLWEWLTATEVDGGYVKEPPRLTIQAIPGGFIASVSDASLAKTVDVTIRTLDEALDALEKGLRDCTCTVRSWGKKKPTLRKKPAAS